MSTVLLVGEDELIQQIRAAVLRTIGAEIICSSAKSALAIQAAQQCDLVILCHSLPEQLSAALAQSIRVRWPETPILQVASSRKWEATGSDESISAVSSADPERLIVRTTELLGDRSSNNSKARELMQ
jgi:DNA-binding response OmpR family regulator